MFKLLLNVSKRLLKVYGKLLKLPKLLASHTHAAFETFKATGEALQAAGEL